MWRNGSSARDGRSQRIVQFAWLKVILQANICCEIMKSKLISIFRISVKNRMKYRQKCTLMMQKMIRGYLARKQHQPRYRGILKINGISADVKKMQEIANQLKKEKDSMLKQIKDIEEQIQLAIKKIKVWKI